jgi:glyoxylase-like metal-dependent hydrolase (beta-lactamase superfamily II)
MVDSPGAPGAPVTDGIGRIPGFVNSYTLVDGEDVVLIDTGFSRKAKPIVRAFEAARVPLSQARKILLTHYHLDHMGGAAYLLQNTQAPVACHAEDVPYVDGRKKAPIPLLMRLFVRIHPAPVATVLNDGDQIGALQVLHTPGHTPGEVVFFHPIRKILFSGDAVVERSGKLTMAAPRYAADLRQAVDSLSEIRDLHAEILLPGHGVPVTRDVDSLLDDLIQRAPGDFLGRA